MCLTALDSPADPEAVYIPRWQETREVASPARHL